MVETVVMVLIIVFEAACIFELRERLKDKQEDVEYLEGFRMALEAKLRQAEQDRRVLGNALIDEVEENL